MKNLTVVSPGEDLPAVPDEDKTLLAIAQSGNMEALEKFLSLREREEARQAALTFDRYFATMQGELPIVRKVSQGHGYKYSSLESIQSLCDPIIAKHGFSYSWDEETLEHGKRVTMTIYGHGHQRKNSMESAMVSGTQRMNAVQVVGATNTYLRRYTFVSGFGVNIVGEDFDGVPQVDPADYSADVASLQACSTSEELRSVWATLYTRYKADNGAISVLQPVYNKMKQEVV